LIVERKILMMMAMLAIIGSLLTSCGGSSTDTTEAVTTAAPTTSGGTDTTVAPTTSGGTDTTAAVEGPTELTMALIVLSVVEEPWYNSMLDAMARAQQAAPYGLDINYEYFEGIDYSDGERVIRELAVSGKYDIIIGHSTYSDAVAAVKDEFPDTVFAFSGSGNEPTGGNGYWIDVMLHEPAYVAGVAAGLLSETNSIGAVAAFPFPNVNGPVNAYFDGARSVKPDIETQVTYIESWFDPAKAREAAEALINAGADSLYATSTFGTFQAIAEGDRVFGIGDFADLSELAPHAVITSTVAFWDPSLNTLIDAWWDHHASGVAYDAPMERVLFLMADGGGDIAPLNEALVPEDVRTSVLEVRGQILSGDLIVELKDGPVE
jgi:basic membrane lipoprotein Med (substrate-binding protein (PBP1-ABC) superfamily)